jgi:hypothetical protein
MNTALKPAVALGIAANIFVSGYSIAQENNFSLELNSAKDNENGCRLTYVAKNKTGVVLEKTSYEVVVFDKDGGVAQFLILEFGKLPVNKTKVVQFELNGQKCADISRLLINDVSDCEADGQTVPICLDALTTSSRTSINFGT